ncbi:MAG TPA: TonB-dependent receptor [Candidatus Krumholzibacteria bacterium]|nr:TonB-dependent receptor [Candidatus Krumholzibacteria bacterium]
MTIRTFRAALARAVLLLVPLPLLAAAPAAPDTLVHRTDDVVITASRYETDVHLNHADIPHEELQARIGVEDIPMLLTDTPGLHAFSDAGNGVGYTYLNIRGFDQKRVGVTFDGIPLNDPEDHQVYWVDLPDFASALQDIQVQRGVTNSMGGGAPAIGGSVNLVTRRLSLEPRGELSAMGGAYGTWRLMGAYQTGLLADRFQSSLRWSRIESDGYRDRTASELWGLYWKGQALLGDHVLRLDLTTGHELSRHGWNAAYEDDLAVNRRANPETYANAIDDFRQPHAALHHTYAAASNVTLRTSAFWIHGEGFYENLREGETAAVFNLDHTLGLDPDAEVDLVRRKIVDKDQLGLVSHVQVDHRGGRLIAGGDVYDFHSDHHGEVLEVAGLYADRAHGLDYYEYDGDKTAWSLYANEAYEVLPGLTLLADLQYQRKDAAFAQAELGNFTGLDRHAYQVSYDFFNPKGGLAWDVPGQALGGRLTLSGQVGVTHREPTDGEVYDTWQGPDDLGVAPLFRNGVPTDEDGDGQPDYVQWSDPVVGAEKALDYELGLRWRAERVSLTVNGYWMNFDDEIVPFGSVDDDGFPVKGNAERTLHRGVELGLTARLTDAHVLSVAASRSWDEFDRFTYYETLYDDAWNVVGVEERDLSGNPVPLFPEHLASVTLASDFGALDSRVRLRSVGRQFLDVFGLEERTIDAYALLDVALGLDLGRAFGPASMTTRLDLRVNNVLDREYETTGYWYEGRWLIPGAGRHLLAGLHAEF